jgi:hypothetical protein
MTAQPPLTAARVTPPPDWALAQRQLIAVMDDAAPRYQERYTRADGTFIWRQTWPGMDGSDDGYESYHNWPLLYALGGSPELHTRSRFLWDAVTRQFSAYGQVWREFDAYYDWMHHGESSLFFYYFGLADPRVAVDRARAVRFARMYTGDDPEAPNYDPALRMMRSPITGSKGPRFENSWDDWSTHRAVLANYPAPFEDIPGVQGAVADWNDDAVYAEILKLLNARQMNGDVPLNLTATSLVTHAYISTGDERFRRWALDYLEAWNERIAANGGLCPDNIGPSGKIGELMGGKWWGGYYGWRWPHGFMTIIQPLTVAAMNAVLLTGDMRYLDIPRGQIDRIWEMGRLEDGRLLVPNRYTDAGWTAFRPISPEYPLQLWYMSQAAEDEERLARFPERLTDWLEVKPGRGKGDTIHIAPWYSYLQGRLPDYPRQILAAQWREVARRMELIRTDDADPETVDVHHWQDRNPVHTEALLQLTCGGPQVIYHGGLLHTRLRYFDALERRPGLPADVGALVSAMDAGSVTLELANISPTHERRLVLQAGAFGEHRFTGARELGAEEPAELRVDGPHLHLTLPPGHAIGLRLGMDRYVHQPSYSQPV